MFCISVSYGSHPSGQIDVPRTKHSLHILKSHPVSSSFISLQTKRKKQNVKIVNYYIIKYKTVQT